MEGALKNRRVVVAVGGGIAAYKAVELVRALQRDGAQVRVAMTPAATSFVGPLTLEALTRHAVLTQVLGLADDSSIEHVEWGHWAELLVVAPATADLLARMAAGMANDAVTAMALCVRGARVLCPAMEPGMWDHPATRRNLATLEAHGARVVPPDAGPLASGRSGVGRLATTDAMVAACRAALRPQDLAGRHVLVTAGPTREHLDPVRFLSNPSTGKMGLALAAAALERGATVTVVHGPIPRPPPPGCTAVPVTSALQMLDALQNLLPHADVLLMAAAVGDWRAAEISPHKVKKGGDTQTITLVANPDLLLSTRMVNPRCVRVGFAAETQDVLKHAREKLVRKGLALLVANNVSQPDAGFQADTNRVVILDPHGGEQSVPLMSKEEVAHAIVDRVVPLLAAQGG
jgi:phosphopantothenoylcysteine decarboxylase/phosphopantothenate--cysteine ligase